MDAARKDPRWPRSDDAETVGTMRRALTTLFLVGALTAVNGVWMTQRTTTGKFAQGGCALALALCGLALLALRPRRRVLEAFCLSSILIISVLVMLTNPLGTAPMFYLWPVVFIAYFSSRRLLGFTFGLMTLSLGIALTLNTSYALKVDAFTGCTACVGLMAALVSFMTRREARLRCELALAANTDPLTGLLNRRAFNPELAALVDRAGVLGAPFSVVMLDIDHFKRFNDDHGHLAGDEALCRVAELLRRQSGEHDLVARFGGEEFAVALPGAGIDRARDYAERIGRMLHDDRDDGPRRVTVSLGIATLADDRRSVDALVSAADDALYAAKKAGRARAAWWDTTICVGPAIGVPAMRQHPALLAG